ncbi:serine carboxypeptidase-like 18 [Mangifera indica]|uniref:serine carboxypeptidase-like 18 n=1 Tax=Mangifera indica TaxID=29780 RepID=UPI001CFBB80C|nr:serine carboxypeptidase-like 18 [Mangifera indica]
MTTLEAKPFYKCFTLCFQILLLLAYSIIFASAKNVITHLPGFDGQLPFYLETGYIGVGESNESQLFYYFVESQRSPSLDPLMLWLTGGPGCSVLSAFFYESGPVAFDYANYNGSLPLLHLNPDTWTKGLNIIYVDAPVGTGFSYSTTPENYYVNDTKSAWQTYEFLLKWLLEHPQFLKNQFFMGGDSYSGIPLPMIVQHILDGNNEGMKPTINLKGYILGNPKTDDYIDSNSLLPFAFRVTLIPPELYHSAKYYCNGDYVNINESNTGCVAAIDAYEQLVLQINIMNILEPNCQTAKPRKSSEGRRSAEEIEPDEIPLSDIKSGNALWCRDYNYVLSAVWANARIVREALHVRDGTVGVWKRCNSSIAYTKTQSSTVGYHKNFTSSSLRALIYSGDHDFSVPHTGTETWIRSLNMTINEDWRAWFVEGQVAGYTEKLISSDFTLIFATVKGGGHVAPEYKPKECYKMIDRFMAYFPL